MVRERFNDGWYFGRGSGSALSAMFGGAGEEIPVTLPHDAAILEQRDAQDIYGSGNAYFSKDNYHYTKKFRPDGKDKDKKSGKGRPFEILLIPAWIATFAMFGIPLGWTAVVQYIAVFVLYTLIVSVFHTAVPLKVTLPSPTSPSTRITTTISGRLLWRFSGNISITRNSAAMQ